MRIVPVTQLFDNYAYLAIDDEGVAAVVDPAEAAKVLDAVAREGVRLAAILSTHHHPDHVGGNEELVDQMRGSGFRVFGYSGDAERIPGITDELDDGEEFAVSPGLRGRAIFIPAHTRGHLAYYFESDSVVFTGDTLFAGGCGRLFEGDARQMKASLERLAALPDETLVYCGHEYTKNNLDFAALLEPDNARLQARRREVEALLAAGRPSLPTTVATEKATNPFLRSFSPELRRNLAAKAGTVGDDDVDVFAATRLLKDNF